MRLDVFSHSCCASRFETLELLMRRLIFKETQLMALSQDILDALAQLTASVDAVVAGVGDGSIGGGPSPADKAALLDNLARNRDALNALLPPPPPV